MSEKSLIEWCDATWNPVLGCDPVSPGCANCYAIRSVWRMMHNPNAKIAAANAGLVHRMGNGRLGWTGEINTLPDRLDAPLHWKAPLRIFVNSQSDLFHPNVPDEFIGAVITVCALACHHTYQILTKRPERMAAFFAKYDLNACMDMSMKYPIPPISSKRSKMISEAMRSIGRDPQWFPDTLPMPHIWLGISAENQETYDARMPFLRQTPAVIRFLSLEPLLGPIDPSPAQWRGTNINQHDWLHDVNWVIVGGESGPNARPMHPDWARLLRDRCWNRDDMGRPWPLPFFFKQHGEWTEVAEPQGGDQFLICREKYAHGDRPRGFYWELYPWKSKEESGGAVAGKYSPFRDVLLRKVGKKTAGRLLDGREWNEYPRTERTVTR